MGAYLQITPALKTRLGYGEVRGCILRTGRHSGSPSRASIDGETVRMRRGSLRCGEGPLPVSGRIFATVLCCELIEHLVDDPMHMMSEINRFSRPGGYRPDDAEYRIAARDRRDSAGLPSGILSGLHSARGAGRGTDARHNREYTPQEILRLLLDGGFEKTLLETGPFREEPKPEHEWVLHLLERV